jgi:type VI secretion system protein ImpE
MTAAELYKSGRLQDAIAAQVEDVKGHPTDHAKRLFLFELLTFAGDLERARRQIDVIKYEDTHLDASTAIYRRLLESELARRDLFSRGVAPGFFGEPPEHLRLRVDAVNRLRDGQPAEAAKALAHANEAVPTFRGQFNGQPFESLRDADDLLAGVLEVMAHGRYFWVGLEQVRLLTTNTPRFPRDLLYIPAHLELEDEQGEVFLPALYPGSHEHPDDQVKLGRATDWKELDGGATLGLGLHTFLRDDDAIGLLECRELRSDDEAQSIDSEA